jgi:alkylation response protein AidB-like acyl-CoA dehydrogenase
MPDQEHSKPLAPQAKDFGFGEEQAMLRDSVRKFFQDNLPVDKLHALVADEFDPHRELEAKWDRALWQQMVELGWTALAVPESCGGSGMGLVAVAGIAEEAGRAAFPSPLISTLCATYVLRACSGDKAATLLQSITEGAAISLAITNHRGSWEPGDTDVELLDGKLNGTAYYVQDAQKVGCFIVSARQGDTVALYSVAADAPGLHILPDAIVDLTRDQARLEFSGVDADCLDAAGEVVLGSALPACLTIIAADMCGAAEWQLQTTTEYATVRTQFERQIGFFQAVKHPLVNFMIMIDQAKSLVYNAACIFDHEPAAAEQAARMAKSLASDMASFGSSRSVQFHGGIGFTWECFVHLYFKRQLHNALLLGDGAYQRRKLALKIMGTIAA